MTHLKVNRTELTPMSFLARSAYVFPDKVAVVHGSRRYRYRQLAEREPLGADEARDTVRVATDWPPDTAAVLARLRAL